MSTRFTISDIARSAVGGINKTAGIEKKLYQFIIGIDCGVQTGLCVYGKADKQISEISTLKIHVAMERVKFWHSSFKIFVRVEDARLRKWIPAQATESAERGRREGAGSVKRDAVIWQDFLSDLGIDHEMVAPKNNKTKVSDTYFKSITGYSGVTSIHARDAAMLVVGF